MDQRRDDEAADRFHFAEDRGVNDLAPQKNLIGAVPRGTKWTFLARSAVSRIAEADGEESLQDVGDLTASLSPFGDGLPALAQPFEVAPQVLAIGVVRDRDGEKTAGLELAAETHG